MNVDICKKLAEVYDLNDKDQKKKELAIRKRFWQIFGGLTRQSLTCEMRRVVCGPCFTGKHIANQHEKAIKQHKGNFNSAMEHFGDMWQSIYTNFDEFRKLCATKADDDVEMKSGEPGIVIDASPADG